MKSFAQTVKKVRKKLNISQEQLARELHVSISTVNRWNNGKFKLNNLAKKILYDFCENKSISVTIDI